MAKRKNHKTTAPIRIDDIDWNGIAKALSNSRLNAKQSRDQFCPQITAPTFKRWAESPDGLGAKFSIDWGRTGRGNYIRLIPRSVGESDLFRTMAELVSTHGVTSCARALAEVLGGTRR